MQNAKRKSQRSNIEFAPKCIILATKAQSCTKNKSLKISSLRSLVSSCLGGNCILLDFSEWSQYLKSKL
jgi:hypothetical protein